ncbi:MAG: hypothetical protein ACYDCM_04660 [Candidatus Acidiferrales bacterium]
MDSSSYKFGYLTPANEDLPFRYSNTWAVEKTTAGTERLVIASASDHVALISELSQLMRPPFWVLYVLLVPRTGSNHPGRYQSPNPLTAVQLAIFLNRFREYFEQDARHHIWISEAHGSSLLVYDNHNVIYAYGLLENYEKALRLKGFEEAPEVVFPKPHSHHYNPECDKDETDIVNYLPWTLSPLKEADNP